MFYPLLPNWWEIDYELAVARGQGLQNELLSGGESCSSVAAATAAGTVKRWLVDTATGNHFVGPRHLSQQQIDSAVPMDPVRLATANGVIDVDKGVWLYVDELELWVLAYILEDSPPALSAGSLCPHDGCSISWPT